MDHHHNSTGVCSDVLAGSSKSCRTCNRAPRPRLALQLAAKAATTEGVDGKIERACLMMQIANQPIQLTCPFSREANPRKAWRPTIEANQTIQFRCPFSATAKQHSKAWRPTIEALMMQATTYPASLRLRVPRELLDALRLAAQQHHTTASEWSRRSLIKALEMQGVRLSDGRALEVE
jgi:hypothetical protein